MTTQAITHSICPKCGRPTTGTKHAQLCGGFSSVTADPLCDWGFCKEPATMQTTDIEHRPLCARHAEWTASIMLYE